MCGIVGELAVGARPTGAIPMLVRMMALRGPDDEGMWNDEHCTLGFRRLAILDLSPLGHQPMHTADGRYTLVYNGEIYNYLDIRAELERTGVRFRSSGDTEVLLYALAYWGTDALRRLNGMFALALYDAVENRLLLARDHAGIKPLYYLQTREGVMFASQYDQILAHPWCRSLRVQPEVVAIYLRQGYIPAPYALLEKTHLLESGAVVVFSADGSAQHGRSFTFPQFQQPDLVGEAANEAVEAAVTEAVRRQMISDVPIGAFLSGGIDSPLVVAKMRTIERVNAFTIGTNGDENDESSDAQAYARQLNIDHHIEHIKPAQATELLEAVVAACGEPFGDYSIFPTMLVSRHARQRITVMLSGDGGDELFFGYTDRFGSILKRTADFRYPQWLRTLRWGLKRVFNLGDGYYQLRFPSVGNWFEAKHTHMPGDWINRLLPDAYKLPVDYTHFDYRGGDVDQTAQWMRWNEFVGHLSRVLLKVDRASMYHSLEVRVPLLDREVIDTALRVDWRASLNLSTGEGKIPLRRALARHVQGQTKAKRGFGAPMDAWLRGAFRPVIEDVLLNRTTIAGLPFNREAARNIYMDYLSAPTGPSWGLWILLSFALWDDHHYQSSLITA